MKPTKQPTFVKLLEEVGRIDGRGPLEAFLSFTRLAACAVSAGAREEEYLAEAARWDAEAMDIFARALSALITEMDPDPFCDKLGPLFMEWGSKSGHQLGGEFYTPPELCRMMAKMTLGSSDIPRDRAVTVLEPCCGSGGMILATAQELQALGVPPTRMRATCIDVSRTACDMCYVNLTLWGIPAVVVHGNALTVEQWGAWRTPFWWLASGGAVGKPNPVPPCEAMAIIEGAAADVAARQTKTGQFYMDLEGVA